MKSSEIVIDDYNIDGARQMLHFFDGLPVACGYIRVSSPGQADRGHSPQSQIAQARNECLRRFGNGYHLVIIEDLGFSGDVPFSHRDCPIRPNRPGLTFLVELIERRLIQFVITLDCSRLCRDLFIWKRLKKEILDPHGAAFISVLEEIDTLDPERTCELDEHMARAAAELKHMARRIKKGLHDRASAGYLSGIPPFGWRWEEPTTRRDDQRRSIIPVEEQVPVVRKAVHLCLSGRAAYWISREFNRCGVSAASGSLRLSERRIMHMLRSPVHCGYMRDYDGNIVRGAHYEHRIIEKSEFDAVQELLADISTREWYQTSTEDRIYGDLLKCGICGAKLGYRSVNRQRCCEGRKKGSKHDCFTVLSANLYNIIHTTLMELANSERFTDLSEARMQRMLYDEFGKLDDRRKRLLAQIESNRRSFVQQARTSIRRRVDLDDVADKSCQERESLEAELNSIDAQLAEKDKRRNQLSAAASHLRGHFTQMWKSLDIDAKRKVAANLVTDASVKPDGDYIAVSLRLVTGEQITRRLYSWGGKSLKMDGMLRAELYTAHYLLQGMTIEEIAAIRGVAIVTVMWHVHNLRVRAGTDDIFKVLELAAPIVKLRKKELELCETRPENDVTVSSELHRQVLIQLAAGHLPRDISEVTGLEMREIERIRTAFYRRFDAHSPRQALQKAVELGLMPDPEKSGPPESEDLDIIRKLSAETSYAEVASQHGLSVKALMDRLKELCAAYCVTKPHQLFELAHKRNWFQAPHTEEVSECDTAKGQSEQTDDVNDACIGVVTNDNSVEPRVEHIPCGDRVAVGLLMKNGCVAVAEQKEAITNACRVKFRYDEEIVWVEDTSRRDAACNSGGASRLSALIDTIRRREVKCLVFYSCQNAALDPDSWQKLITEYLIPLKIQAISIRERINTPKDLARYVDAVRREKAVASTWNRAHSATEHPRRPLSPRQRQVLELKEHGLTRHEIAQHLHLRESYVESLLRKIRNKSGVTANVRQLPRQNDTRPSAASR
ncbi:MAG: recombinase family protein [Armatimonadota bacterium]|nr:recombinase family protein [bacterium]